MPIIKLIGKRQPIQHALVEHCGWTFKYRQDYYAVQSPNQQYSWTSFEGLQDKNLRSLFKPTLSHWKEIKLDTDSKILFFDNVLAIDLKIGD